MSSFLMNKVQSTWSAVTSSTNQQLVHVRWFIIGCPVVTPNNLHSHTTKSLYEMEESVKLHCLYWCCYIKLCPFFVTSLNYQWCTITSTSSVLLFSPINNLIFISGYVFLGWITSDLVGGHLYKGLKLLLPCNYVTLIRFIRHIMNALYIPEPTGHVQSDSALFINISTL